MWFRIETGIKIRGPHLTLNNCQPETGNRPADTEIIQNLCAYRKLMHMSAVIYLHQE